MTSEGDPLLVGQGEFPFAFPFILLMELFSTENYLCAGMPRLSAGLDKMSGQWSRASPTEADKGGGEPGGGPIQADMRGIGEEAMGRERGRSRPGSCSRCGLPTLLWSRSCGFCGNLGLTGYSGLERVSGKLSRKGQGKAKFQKGEERRKRQWSR